MKFIDAVSIEKHLDYPSLMTALERGFADPSRVAPVRTAHTLRISETGQDTLLMMPAWNGSDALGVKLVTVMLSRPASTGSTVNSIYMLLDGVSGQPIACMDGDALTKRRTAAVSALAARKLARSDAAMLLMVGTGSLSLHMVRAHASARHLRRITLWGRNAERTRANAERLRAFGLPIETVDDLEAAAARADIICCATTARAPIISGAWLRPGQHLDLVGGFKPDMREADDDAIRAASVFVDTRAGALAEAGDLLQPLNMGVITANHVRAELADLCAGRHPGRRDSSEITLFKSVGTAVADLMAAQLVYARLIDDSVQEHAG